MYYYFHESFYNHKARYSHPESPDRLKAIQTSLASDDELKQYLISKIPSKATTKDLLRVHTQKYIDSLFSKFAQNIYEFDDGDTYISEGSHDAALYAAGAVIGAVKSVKADLENAFCAVRPPGHHATPHTAMGFCLLNNIAIGAAFALEECGFKRVIILDWDVHHGNGTQDIFYNRNDVLFISLHQYPFYPGTGSKNEIGYGQGKGFTLNFPLPVGTDGKKYVGLLTSEILPRVEEFNPDLFMISAGFDAHENDPLGGMTLKTSDFATMTELVYNFCKIANIPVVSVLEGGYHLDSLAESVHNHIRCLCGLPCKILS